MLKKFKVALAGSVLAAGSLILPAAAAAPASAATPAATAVAPGSSCLMLIALPYWWIAADGHASANGEDCVPDTPLSGPLAVLNVGLPCSNEEVYCQGEPRPPWMPAG